MKRIYLNVPPEEDDKLRKLRARWDSGRQSWYINDTDNPAPFKRWIPGDPEQGEEDYTIESEQAFIAVAKTECRKCGTMTVVICIYCDTGKIKDEPCGQFTVTDITRIDESVKEQLEPWPDFRYDSDKGRLRAFMNHCSRCNAVQSDFYLHTDPEGPFFTIAEAPPDTIEFIPLKGKLRVRGNPTFEFEYDKDQA